MLSFQSQSVDHVVTPNHDLYVNVGNKDKHLARGFSKRKAAEHPQYRGWRCWSTAPEWSGKSPETVVIGEHVLPAMEAAEFFGWYVSEGSVIEGVAPMRRVTISQSKERSPAEWARIEHLLTVLGLPYVARKDGKAFRINSKVLAEFMASEFGPRGREIRVPDWLMEWDKPELDRFLEAYFLGDGTSNESGKGVLEASCVVARTCSQALVDSMQALCARLGWTVTIGGWRDFPYGGTEYVGRALTYSFKRRQLVGLPVPEVVHVENREVWCPTLPNGVWLVRRNGKAIWTGNSADRLDSLPKQPLGTLARMTGIDLLIGPHPDLPLFGLPWLQTWNDLPVWMDRWRRWSDDLRAEWEWPLMVTHAPIFPRGEEPPYDYIDAENWADLMVNGDCYVGHIHDPHGVYQPLKHRAVMLCNHGAISRGSLHEKTLKREPAVTLWDSEKSGTQRFLRIPLNVRPVEAVFRLHEKEDADEKVSRVEAFLEQIGQTRLDGLALEEVRERARRSGLRTETVTLIEELLEAVS